MELDNFPCFLILQLRQEKMELEQTLEKEQEYQINKLMRKIEKLEADTLSKQQTLEQVSFKKKSRMMYRVVTLSEVLEYNRAHIKNH